jgi:hypothetical protein
MWALGFPLGEENRQVPIIEVAIVSETQSVTCGQLAKVAAALQKQATRDFGPLWDVKATVNAFERLEDVPVGYWPIIVMDDINQPGAAGVHLDKNGQPLALVQYDDGWALTASQSDLLRRFAQPMAERRPREHQRVASPALPEGHRLVPLGR